MGRDCTCSALRMAARRLTQAYDAALAPAGVNTPQYALLNRLEAWDGEPPTMRQLADRLGLDRTTLAHNLRPLERDGLVAVAADDRDRRVKRIRLTATGRARRDLCYPLWHGAQERFEQAFGRGPTAALMAALRSITQIHVVAPATPQETSHAL